MKVHYCDLCSQPLRLERHIIVVIHDKNFRQKVVSKDERKDYEVCDSCLKDLKHLFDSKKSYANQILEYIENKYNKPSKRFKGRKTCSQCNKVKDVSKFNKNKRAKDGLSYYCRTCRKKNRRKSK